MTKIEATEILARLVASDSKVTIGHTTPDGQGAYDPTNVMPASTAVLVADMLYRRGQEITRIVRFDG